MGARQLPDFLSFLDEYPVMKKYNKREIGPLGQYFHELNPDRVSMKIS
jgi:hypothetical protein